MCLSGASPFVLFCRLWYVGQDRSSSAHTDHFKSLPHVLLGVVVTEK